MRRKRNKSIICIGIITFFCVCLLNFNLKSKHKEELHQLTKRNVEKLPPDAFQDDFNPEAVELVPGQLICELPKGPRPTRLLIPPLEPLLNTDPPVEEESGKNVKVAVDLVEVVETNKDNAGGKNSVSSRLINDKPYAIKEPDEKPLLVPPVEKPAHKVALVDGWREPTRKIGCCPAGDRKGKSFTEGFACCVDEIYNGTSEFCCLSKKRKLLRTDENLSFCYPPNRTPFCRISDLRLDQYRPMEVVCTNAGSRNKEPSECTFLCPPGSQVRGDKTVTCSSVGNWNDADPQCCEGCPVSFKQDIWFVVDIEESVGTANLSSIRNFIKFLVGYFPVGQNKVRVAVTAYNGVIFKDQNTWHLNRYNSTEELNRAIHNLPREGSGRQTGSALTWLSRNAFKGRMGDRANVDNVIVLITTGEPENISLLERSAESLRKHSKLITIAVGPEAKAPALRTIVSLPQNQNYLRLPSFANLDLDVKYLYDLLCEEHCLGRDMVH